jgi:hypothetical protein
MPLPIVPVRAGAGPVTVEILVQQAQFGEYDVWLWDARGKTRQALGQGLNTDEVPDVITVLADPTPSADRSILHWRIRVASFTGQARDRYYLTVILRQNGAPVPGGTLSASGELADMPIEITGGLRLAVVPAPAAAGPSPVAHAAEPRSAGRAREGR